MEIQSTKDIFAPPLHALIYGDSGAGKTFSLQTLPKPIFVFCSDPDGMVTLRGIPDIDFIYIVETEKSHGTVQLEKALFEFESKLLTQYKSVAFDSITTLTDIIMNHCIRLTGRDPLDLFPSKKGKETGVLLGPNQQDYGNEMTLIHRLIAKVLSWPINIVFTGHVEITKDQLSGRVFGSPMVTGKLKGRLPNLFTEVYYVKREGPRYIFRTKPDGIYMAKSRLSQKGLLNEVEEPDFSAIIKKTGVDSNPRPGGVVPGERQPEAGLPHPEPTL
jgi:hypothetical protein